MVYFLALEIKRERERERERAVAKHYRLKKDFIHWIRLPHSVGRARVKG
jgi:hypothetical protein